MIDFLDKHAILLFTALALGLLICSLFLPASAGLTGAASLALILGAAILQRTRVHRQAFKRGEISDAVLKRNITVDASVILVVFLLISAAGRWAGGYASLAVAKGTEPYWPGMGGTLGLLTALITGFAVGFGGWRLAAWAQARLRAHETTFSSHHNQHRSQR